MHVLIIVIIIYHISCGAVACGEILLNLQSNSTMRSGIYGDDIQNALPEDCCNPIEPIDYQDINGRNNLLSRLDGIEARFEEGKPSHYRPPVIADMKRYVKLTKEYSDLERLTKATRAYIRTALDNIAEAHEVFGLGK